MKTNAPLPINSRLRDDGQQFHYVDSCTVPLQHSDATAHDAVTAFFQSSPKWLNALFKLRNKIVGALGLKTGTADLAELRPPYRIGQKFGLFKLISLSQTEAIMGEDDRHLNFRTSFIVAAPTLVISTAVLFHNRWGRLYFFIIKPFHRMMMPIMAKKMAAFVDRPQQNT